MWNFGSGKTFWSFLELFKVDKEKTYIIANVPYSIVDHYYSTTEDLLKVFDILGRYSIETNKNIQDFYGNRNQIKDIILIVDEAHLYLWARESLTKASILNDLKTIFTQCRKRKIRVVFITQRLTQIDIYVRRLSDYVEEYSYNNWGLVEFVRKRVYLNKGDVADIETDTTTKFTNDWEATTYKDNALLSSEFFWPLTSILELFEFFSKGYRKALLEEYQTYHICGYPDLRVKDLNYEQFRESLKIHQIPKETFFTWLKKKFNGYYDRIKTWITPKPNFCFRSKIEPVSWLRTPIRDRKLIIRRLWDPIQF